MDLIDELFGPDITKVLCVCGHPAQAHTHQGIGNCTGHWEETGEGLPSRKVYCGKTCYKFIPPQGTPDSFVFRRKIPGSWT